MDYFYEPSLSTEDKTITLKGTETGHIIKVLRYKEGAVLNLLNGRGGVFEGIISAVRPDATVIKISNSIVKPPYPSRLHIAIGLLKKTERLEWFIEKAIETGIAEISIFYSTNSEKKSLNMDRIWKIAIAAMKQSGNPWLPTIHGPISFGSLIQTPYGKEKYIGYCAKEKVPHLAKAYKQGTDALILIGPEGDFTEEEVLLAEHAGFKRISLGENRLRTETAALTSLIIMETLNER